MYTVLKSDKRYLRLLLADIISRFGDCVDIVAYSWIVFETTGSSALTATIFGFNFLTTAVLMPYASSFIKQKNKKLIMCLTDIVRFILVMTVFILYQNGILNPVVLLVATIITSAAEACRIPASSDILPMIVGEHFSGAKRLSYRLTKLAELSGLTIAGAMIAWFGVPGSLLFDAVTFLISAILISTIKYKEQHDDEHLKISEITNQLKIAFLNLKNNKNVKYIFILSLILNFAIMPLTVFQTPYVARFLNMGPDGLSYLKIAMSIGLISGAFLSPRLSVKSNFKSILLFGIALGFALLGMGIFPMFIDYNFAFVCILVCMAIIGTCISYLNTISISMTIAHSAASHAKLKTSFASTLQFSTMPIAAFACALLVLFFSILQILLIFGVLAILIYPVIYLKKQNHN